MHSAYIDHTESLGVFKKDVGERVVVVIREREEAAIVSVVGNVIKLQMGLLRAGITIEESNLL